MGWCEAFSLRLKFQEDQRAHPNAFGPSENNPGHRIWLVNGVAPFAEGETKAMVSWLWGEIAQFQGHIRFSGDKGGNCVLR